MRAVMRSLFREKHTSDRICQNEPSDVNITSY